jgi:hypothetical protein
MTNSKNFLLFATAFVLLQVGHCWKYCDKWDEDRDKFLVSNFKVEPRTLDSVRFKLHGAPEVVIARGGGDIVPKIHLKVYESDSKNVIYSGTKDMCDYTDCSLKADEKATIKVPISDLDEQLKREVCYTGEIRIVNKCGEKITCVQDKFYIAGVEKVIVEKEKKSEEKVKKTTKEEKAEKVKKVKKEDEEEDAKKVKKSKKEKEEKVKKTEAEEDVVVDVVDPDPVVVADPVVFEEEVVSARHLKGGHMVEPEDEDELDTTNTTDPSVPINEEEGHKKGKGKGKGGDDKDDNGEKKGKGKGKDKGAEVGGVSD